jgi:hypothetical protein
MILEKETRLETKILPASTTTFRYPSIQAKSKPTQVPHN